MQSYTNQFLIAMPALNDPNFERSVTLMCLHDEQSALGVVINRPIDMDVSTVLTQLQIQQVASRDTRQPVYIGGPVESQMGLVLHDGSSEYESSIEISDTLTLTLSMDVLEAIAAGNGPERSMLCLGYAGWGAGQLEEEMAQNAWLTVDADAELVFATPSEERWDAAAKRLGVDFSMLSADTGRA